MMAFADEVPTDVAEKVDTAPLTKREKIHRRLHRMDRNIQQSVFVPKGTWMIGGQISYGTNSMDNINVLVLENVKFANTSFGVSPFASYFFKDNISAGVRFNYNYNKISLDNLDLSLGQDLNISLKDLYFIENSYQVSGFLRTYMSLSKSKIFAFFNEVRVTYGHSSGKNTRGIYDPNNQGEYFRGTYANTNSLHIGFAPGLTAFVQDWMAVEVQMGVMGFGFNWQTQETKKNNAPDSEGKVNSFNGKFKIDLFSIAIGTTFYL